MLLSAWIEKNGGTGKTGNLLGFKRNCVYAWLHGIALPRPAVMKDIVKKSAGAVTYAEMIDEHLACKKARALRPKAVARKKKSSAKTKKKSVKIDPGF